MAASVRLSTGTKALKGIQVRDGGNVARTIKSGFIRTSAGLKQFFGSFSLTLSSTEAEGYGYSYGKPSTLVATTYVMVTVTGGNAPFTYNWHRTDAGSNTITITNPTSPNTMFRGTVPNGGASSGTFACAVQDASGQVLTTPDVTVQLQNVS